MCLFCLNIVFPLFPYRGGFLVRDRETVELERELAERVPELIVRDPELVDMELELIIPEPELIVRPL